MAILEAPSLILRPFNNEACNYKRKRCVGGGPKITRQETFFEKGCAELWWWRWWSEVVVAFSGFSGGAGTKVAHTRSYASQRIITLQVHYKPS